MPRPPSSQPTDGELEILRVLWRRQPRALGEICTALRQQRDVAPSTVATMLRVMHEKGFVQRTGNGRAAVWKPTISQQAAAKGMVNQLVERLFEGSTERLAAHLVEGGQLNAAQLAELRNLIDQQHSPPDTGRRSDRAADAGSARRRPRGSKS